MKNLQLETSEKPLVWVAPQLVNETLGNTTSGISTWNSENFNSVIFAAS